MEFRVLGPVCVREGEREFPLGSARERTVLAILLLHSDRFMSAERLINALWSDPPATARAQIHNLVSSLRRRYRDEDPGLIGTRPGGYQLRLAHHRLDLAEFRRLVALGAQATKESDHPAAFDAYTRALAWWRGVPLTDVIEGFATDVRPALQEEWLGATEARMDVQLTLRRHDEVLRQAGELLTEHPYREHLYRRQMLALVGAGRAAEALEVYRHAYVRLSEELGILPGAELRDLERRILRGERVAATVDWRTLPRELPTRPGRLVGRDDLLRRVQDCLRDRPVTQPVVLVGPGGVGKSALALTVAHELAADFPDGQLYADLRGVQDNPTDPHAVLGRFLRALGLPGPQLPDDADERVAMYRSLVAGRRILTVLDDAGSDAQVRPLLPAGSGCAVLITSRYRLAGLIGAVRHGVPVLGSADAVDLLTRGAGADTGPTTTEAALSIVDMCGQLPLAVCIASARLAARPDWTMDELRERLATERGRLDELTAGDLDVRASIALSYHTLGPGAQRLFRLLSLVPGAQWPGWVAAALLDEPGTVRAVDELVEVHLVDPLGRDRAGQPRFQMHALVRAFAAELAERTDSRDARDVGRRRLLDGWLAAVSTADDRIAHGRTTSVGLPLPRPPAGAERATSEHANEWFEIEQSGLADALAMAVQLDHPDTAGLIALRWDGFLIIRGYRTEHDRALSTAISRVRDSGRDDLLLRLLTCLFALRAEQGRYAELADIAAEKVRAAERVGDRTWWAQALIQAAWAARAQGELAEADELLCQAEETYRGPNASPVLLAGILTAHSLVHVEAGEPEHALPLLAEALPLQRSVEVSRQTALQLDRYADALRDVGRLDEAAAFLDEAMDIAQRLGDEVGMAYLHRNLAEIDIRRGEWTLAAERLQRALRILDSDEHVDEVADTLRTSSDLAAAQGRWVEAARLAREAYDTARDLAGPLRLARFLVRLDRALDETGDILAAHQYRREWKGILRRLRLSRKALGPLPFDLPSGLLADLPSQLHSPIAPETRQSL